MGKHLGGKGRGEKLELNYIEMRIALRADLTQGVSEGTQKDCFCPNPGLSRRIFLPKGQALGGQTVILELTSIKPFPAFQLVGDCPTTETPRNGRDPNLCWRGVRESTISGPADPRFSAQDRWRRLAKR